MRMTNSPALSVIGKTKTNIVSSNSQDCSDVNYYDQALSAPGTAERGNHGVWGAFFITSMF